MKRYILLLLILSWSIFGLNAQTGLKKFTPSGGENFVVETVVKQAGFTQASQLDYMGRSIATRKITYLDDFGRAKQTVDWQSSFGGKDLININVYDPLGRQTKVFLPITGAGYGQYIGGNGEANVKEFYSPLNPEDVNVTPTNFPFSPQVYENSPIDLVLEKGAPGDAWQILNTPGAVNSGHTIKTDYGTNVSATEVKLWTISGSSCSLNGFYALNALYKVVIKDENGNEQTTYKDKRGKVILKRNNDGASQLDTYYVYDELGNNRYVIPPGFTGTSFTDNDASFNAFIYAYKYDDRNRVIEKKLPGKGWDYIVYNKLDQVVATQDAVQRAKSAQEWLISKYDVFGRVILTGVYTYPSSVANTSYRAALQATVDGQSVFQESRVAGSDYSNQSWPVTGITTTLSVNYYDNYSIPGLPVDTVYNFGLGDKYSKMTKTLLTVSKINVLGTAQMLWKVSYYDDEGRVVRNIIQHFKGGVVAGNNYDDIYNTYNFSHELITSIRRHYVNGTEQLYLANRFTYDTQGRPQDIYQKTGDNISTTNPEILLSRKNYNEVGQLTSKQLHSSNISLPSFAQTINYSYNPRGWLKIQSAPLFTENLKHEETITGVTSQYNGNISRQEWGSGKYFNYSYDKLSRLNFALSSEGYNELIGYDGMGNITRLQRKQAGTLVDQLKYTYNGSQLSSVLDSNTVSTSAAFQLPGTTNYTYDVNGNMLSRGNSLSTANNLSSITYNYLNLPNGMTAGTAAMTYTYDATGNKLRKQVPSASINIDYISGIQYEGGVLKYVSNGEGRVVRNSATNYSYEYTLADHLGNGRVYFDINAGAARKIQETDYYAFGLDIQRSIIGTENKYQFNGKEKQDQEKMYDYGARFYDPVIGRWNVVDPLGEKAYDVNLYVYVDNNTVNNLDPTGMETLYGQEAKDAFIKEKEKFLKGDDNNGPGDPIKGRNIVNTKGIIFRKDFKGILYTTFHVQDNKFSAYLQKRIEILEAIEKNNRADHRVGHFNFATGKINGWGGIEPNYFFESIFIGGKLLEGGGLIYESLAAKGGGQLFEVADGVRRAKAAQQLGYETIDAMDNTGNIFQVPIKNLSSPMKSSIDISNPLNQLRYDRIYNGMKAGDKLPPIYVNPGNRGVSIFNVVFKQ